MRVKGLRGSRGHWGPFRHWPSMRLLAHYGPMATTDKTCRVHQSRVGGKRSRAWRRVRRVYRSASVPRPPSHLPQSFFIRPFAVVRRACGSGERSPITSVRAILAVGADGGEPRPVNRLSRHARNDQHLHRTCLMRAVSSCTRLYTERSSLIRRAIFDVA